MSDAAFRLPPDALAALTQASAAINSTLNPEDVLQRIAESVASLMRGEASSVLTLDEPRNRLVFSAAVGERAAALVGRTFDATLGIAGHVLRTGQPANIDDVSRDPDFFRGIDEASRFETRGLLAAPMIYRDEKLGVVEVLNRTDRGSFSADDVQLIKVLADLAAIAVRNARRHRRLKRENQALRSTIPRPAPIIGESPMFQEMMTLADRVAPTHATVLLTGETGTGKEVLARYIHHASPRNDRPFVAVNCAALPDTLLESELFGHEKGAFTGAISQHIGRFELADQGTLFLDEIGDISASTQVKLLRLLQERAFTRVGGNRIITCDVRIIAATNRDLKSAIDEDKFRDDLYYRLNVFPIRIPLLKQRRDDIAKLADHFAAEAGVTLGVGRRRFAPEALALLATYDWPGNIRELANVIERAVLMADAAEILPSNLPAEIREQTTDPTAGQPNSGLRANERAMIVQALHEQHWNQSAAARALGISRDNLRYRIKKYGIRREEAP